MPRILTSYFVVMRKTGSGLEAIVDPSLIRRDIVDLIRTDLDYDPRKIEYIHHCDFGTLVDVTDELIDETLIDRTNIVAHPQYVAWDHGHDQRKNWVA